MIDRSAPMEPLVLTYEERECTLRHLRREQQKLDEELYRLTHLAKTNGDAANMREIVAMEFACVSGVITKVWRLRLATE